MIFDSPPVNPRLKTISARRTLSLAKPLVNMPNTIIRCRRDESRDDLLAKVVSRR
ncbi:MAG TPA: hypothetical protein QGH16_04155 [Verrucomicrobiota bacterium]|nr:hypothetical protein [Verrucomicrobiota bacterium]